jgi:hypothetical protein
MGTLKKCLERHKLGKHEKAIINGMVEDLRDEEGLSAQKAAVEAVKEFRLQVEDDLADIEAQITRKLEQDYQGTGASAFNRWFGKSKAVDAQGRPKILYHGTTYPVDFDAFDTDPQPADVNEDRPERASGADPTAFLGAHFAETPLVANQFARGIYGRKDDKETGRVYPVYLSIERPLVTTEKELQQAMRSIPTTHYALEEYVEDTPTWLLNSRYKVEDTEGFWDRYDKDPEFRREVYEDVYTYIGDRYDDAGPVQQELAHDIATAWKEDLIDQGYDGIQYENDVEGGISWVAFYPWQIKSRFNLAPSKDKPQLLASMKKRPDEEHLKRLPKGVADQVRKDAPLNPKVADLVVALNEAGFKTALSGDLYGDKLVYVDLEGTMKMEQLLFLASRAGMEWPKDWQVMVRDINVTENRVLGVPIRDEIKAVVRNIEAHTPHTRIAKAGTSVSEEEIKALVGALKKSLNKPGAPKLSVKTGVPVFATTQEAWEFGKKATADQVAAMRRLREEILAANAALGASETLSDDALQTLMLSGYQAQLLREAIEASEGRLDEQMIKTAAWVNRSSDDEGRFSVKNVLAWPDGFPRAVIHTTTPMMQRHTDYRAAKDDGDYAAAQRLVKDLVKVDRAKEIGRRYPGAILVPVIEWEAANKEGRVNMIPLAYAFRLAELTGLDLTTDIVNMSKGERTGKDAMARILFRPAFIGAVAPNRDYILVDDAITQGGTMAELRHFIDNAGGTVVLSTSLTAQKDSTQIAPREGTLAELQKKFDPEKARQILADFDIAGDLAALTEGEAKYLAKFASLESFAGKADERLRAERGELPSKETRSDGLIDEADTYLAPPAAFSVKKSSEPSKKKAKQQEIQFTDLPAYATIEGAEPLPEVKTELTALQGIRVQTTGYIAAAGNIARDADDVASAIAAIRKSAQEHAFMVVTGEDGTILEIHRHTKGTKGAANIHTIEMIGRAARIPGAFKVYFVHNHPSGHPLPSGADVNVAERGFILAEQAGLQYQALIIARTSWGTVNPVGNYMTGVTYPIRPTVRKTLLPVKERYLVKPVLAKTQKMNGPADLVEYLKNNDLMYKTGVLFANAQNQAVGFLRIEPSSGPQAATEIIKAAEYTNAVVAFINVTDANETERTRSFFLRVTALTGQDLMWLDVVVRGTSQSTISGAAKDRWIAEPSQDLEETSQMLKSAQITTKHMEAKFSVRRSDIRRAMERGLFNVQDLAISRDLEELTAIDEELRLTRTGQPQGNAIAINNRLQERPYLRDRIRAIQARTHVPMLDADGNLLAHPMEMTTVTNIPGPTASQFYPIGGQRPRLIGGLRTLTQTYLDNMHETAREHFRKAIVKSIEMAYEGNVPAGRSELGTSIKALGTKQRPDKGFALARPLKRSHKTYAALNINTMCPMLIVGCHGCYIDGCYMIGTMENGRAINFYRSAMYTAELLQISDAEVRKLTATGGLRVNGMGDLTWSERFQMEDIVRHAHMRGLPLKIITKQDDTIKIMQWLIKNKVPGAREVIVQPSIDPYWIEVSQQDNLPGSAMKATQVIDMINAGKLEPAAKFIREEMGCEARVINGRVWRKYGWSWDQLKKASKKYPDVRILPRGVVSTAKEIAEYALHTPEVLQTWMHAVMRPGMWSEVEGKDVSDVALNFRDPIAIRKVDGEWRILRQLERGTDQVGEGTDYTKVERYIKENYTKAQQEKIFSVLSGQLAKDESSLCCAAGASLDACFDCQSSCNHGSYYTGAELRDIAARGVKQLAKGAKSIGKRDLLASVRRPVWYSSMEEFLARPGQLPKTSTAANFASLIKGWAKSGKFKAEELEWSELLEWLDAQPVGTKVSATDVINAAQPVIIVEKEIRSYQTQMPFNRQEFLEEFEENYREQARDYYFGEGEYWYERIREEKYILFEKIKETEEVKTSTDEDGDEVEVYTYTYDEKTVELDEKPDHPDDLLEEFNITNEQVFDMIPEKEIDAGVDEAWDMWGSEEAQRALEAAIEEYKSEEQELDEEIELETSGGVWEVMHGRKIYHRTYYANGIFADVYSDKDDEAFHVEISALEKRGDFDSLEDAENFISQTIAADISKGDATIYGEHQLPGGLYYTELLLILKSPVQDKEFVSTHWNRKKNVLAHVRFNHRETADGERILFIEEIQSDWHQKAFNARRKEIKRIAAEKNISIAEAAKLVPKGYFYITKEIVARNEELTRAIQMQSLKNQEIYQNAEKIRNIAGYQVSFDWYNPEIIKYHEQKNYIKSLAAYVPEPKYFEIRKTVMASQEYKDFLELQKQYIDTRTMEQPKLDLMPNAPFKQTWPLLVLKRMVRYAAENRFDKIAWTTGEMQVQRYEGALRRRVDEIRWTKTADEIHIEGFWKNKKIVHTTETKISVNDAIGKTMGEKIIESSDQSGVFKNEDIVISDTGMAGFYDRILPAEANKFFGSETWGKARVGEININAYGLQPVMVHSLDINDTMRQKAMGGMPLFSVRRVSPFFSQLMDAVTDPKRGLPVRATAGQMAASLANMQKQGRFKQEEFAWALEEFFDAYSKDDKVTRDEIVAYVKAHTVPVTELIYGWAGDVRDVDYDIEILENFPYRWGVKWRIDPESFVGEKQAYTPHPMIPGAFYWLIMHERTNHIDPANNGFYLEVRTSVQRVDQPAKWVGPFKTEDEVTAWTNEHYVGDPDRAETDGSPRYDQYGMAGERGANYREIVLKYSPSEHVAVQRVTTRNAMHSMLKNVGMRTSEADQMVSVVTRVDSVGDFPATDAKLRKELGDDYEKFMELRASYWRLGEAMKTGFYGTHFSPERDVLCWIRFDERVDDDGKKVLFIYEIQSDWHQKGQRFGYRPAGADEVEYQIIKNAAGSYDVIYLSADNKVIGRDGGYDSRMIAEDAAKERRTLRENPPDIPFKQTWPLVALKRMAIYAAENNFDRVAWASGLQQYEQWGSERFVWRKIDYRGMTPGEVVPANKALALAQSGVPLSLREDDRFISLDLKDVSWHANHIGSQSPTYDAQQIVVGKPSDDRKRVLAPAFAVEGTEQHSGAIFEQFAPDQIEEVINKIDGRHVSDKTDLAGIVSIIMERKRQEYKHKFPEYVERITTTLWERMQAKPENGEYLPRLEGMRKFYDQRLVTLAKDFFGRKIWGGAEVRPINVRVAQDFDIAAELGAEPDFPELDLASDYAPVFGFDISEEIKAAALTRGLPLFSVKRLDPVSRVYLDAFREAVPSSTTTTDEDIEADIYDGLTDEEKKRLKSSHGLPVPTWLQLQGKNLRERWHEMSRHRPFLDPTQHATVADILRTHQANPENSTRRAMQMLQGIVAGLKPKQYEVFSLSLIMDDMVRDIESGLLSEKEALPFGFTQQSAVRYRDYLRTLAQGDAAVNSALERRRRFQVKIKEALVAAELLPKTVLEDDRYWHHQVLQYHALDQLGEKYSGVGLGADDLRLKKKGWQMKRQGSVQDYNTKYVETEYEWLAQALAQLETRSVMDKLRELIDITGSLRSLAKSRNLEAFYAPVLAQLPAGTTYQDIRGTDLDPLAKYGKAVARAIGALGKMADKGELRGAPEYDDIIDGLAEWFQDEKDRKRDLGENYQFEMPSDLMEGGRLFKFMSHLMANDLPGAPWAGSVFKSVRERNNQIRETLKDKFLTPARIIRTDPNYAGYTEWIPAPGKTWYKAWSIPDRLAADIQAKEAVLDQETFEKARQILARGRDVAWIIPADIAKTLDGFDVVHDDHGLSKASARVMAAWKQWTLISPFRVIKYNLNNFSGDLDITFAFRPKIITHYLPAAIRDLYKDIKGKQMPQALRDELDLAYSLEVLGSGWSVQEVSDVAGQLAFKKHMEALTGDEPTWIARTWRSFKSFTQYRENLLRLAAFRFFRDALRDGQTLYAASNKAEIDGIEDIDRKAAKLARELLGDYGNITHAGQWIRRHLLPFYAWMEVNAPRYVRMMRNVRHEGQGAGTAARIVGVVATRAAWKTSKLAMKMMGFFALASLWNATFFPDEEEELGEQQRRQLHLILGRREDGSIVSLRVQGAFSDALSWFGMEDLSKDVMDLWYGKTSITDIAKDSALATPKKIIGALGPQWKMPGELLLERSYYPDPFNPRPIRDRLEYVSRTFSLGEVYNWAAGAVDWAVPSGMPMQRPRRGGTIGGQLINDLMALALYTADPGEMAYFDSVKLVRDYRSETLGLDNPDKSNALYYYKQSLRMGDLKSAEKYLRHYMSFPGDTSRGLEQSIKRAHPLGLLSRKDRQGFLDSLSPDERRRVEIATEWYNRVYQGLAHEETKRRSRQPPGEKPEIDEPAATTLRDVFNQLK